MPETFTFTQTPLADSYTISPRLFTDSRGWFSRYYCSREFGGAGLETNWVQCNHSFTRQKGAVRGMHYQLHPFGETKLVRCTAGVIFDVIVDVRKDSGSYLQWFGIELSAENKTMIYVPPGFAHGFQTLTPNTEVQYQHSAFYSPDAEAALRFDDPLLNIQWPLLPTEISERDKNHPLIDSGFRGY